MKKSITHISPQMRRGAAKNVYSKGHRIISYTQFSTYSQCPRRWYLERTLKPKFVPSIHVAYGEAMHMAVQKYLIDTYTNSAKYGKEHDYLPYLTDCMVDMYTKYYKVSNEHFSTPDELEEYTLDGHACLLEFKTKQSLMFPTRKSKLHGIELPINVYPHPDFPTVKFTGFIDILTEYTAHGTYDGYDVKTSTSGWSDLDKKDSTKTSQLLLYKKYASEQYEIPIDKIVFSYIILKKNPKLYDGEPVSRIQLHDPAQSERTCNSVHAKLLGFIEDVFESDGKIQNKEYPATSHDGRSCKFCPFNNDNVNCPVASRL